MVSICLIFFCHADVNAWRLTATSLANRSINLRAFDARQVSSQVELTWATASEANNQFFTIEKSTDGTTFYEIGQLNGSGNSSSRLAYSYVDQRPSSGANYYRLRQTDTDGASESFSTRLVHFTPPTDGLVIKSRPGELTVEVTVEQEQLTTLLLYDLGGKVIASWELALVSGFNTVSVDLEATGSRPGGLTVLRMYIDRRQVVKKLLL